MPEPATHDLIQNAARGDTQAFRVLVETHQTFVYAVAYRFVQDEHDAEDITQEVFVRLWKNLHRYKSEAKLTTWLYRIIANQCLDFLKSRHGRQKKNKITIENAPHIPDHTSPEKDYHRHELLLILKQLAEALTPKQRAVFILRDLEGLSPEEVSETLNMASGNVKSNLFHARQKVAEKLKTVYQTTHNPFL